MTLEQQILKELRDVKQEVRILSKRLDISTEWIGKDEIKRLTGWSQRNLDKHSQSGRFTKRVSGGLKFKRSELMEYLDEITTKSKKEVLKKVA